MQQPWRSRRIRVIAAFALSALITLMAVLVSPSPEEQVRLPRPLSIPQSADWVASVEETRREWDAGETVASEDDFEEAAQPGTVEISVVTERGQAAPGIHVRASCPQAEEEEVVSEQVTDVNGHVVVISRPGECTAQISEPEWAEGRAQVEVSAGQVSELRLTLIPGFLLEVQVEDLRARGLEGADISVLGTLPDDGGAIADQVFTVDISTDRAGLSRIRLPLGDYTVAAELPGYSRSSREVALGPPDPVRVRLQLAPISAAIDVQVLCDHGPCASAHVSVSQGDFNSGNKSDDAGRVHFRVPLGEIIVRGDKKASTPQQLRGLATVQVRTSGEVVPCILELVATGGDVALTGDVVDPTGRPWPGATISVTCNTHTRHTATLPDGTFRLEGLPRGACELSLIAYHPREHESEYVINREVEAPGLVHLVHKYPVPDPRAKRTHEDDE